MEPATSPTAIFALPIRLLNSTLAVVLTSGTLLACTHKTEVAADDFACQPNGSGITTVKDCELSQKKPSIVEYTAANSLGESTDGASPFVDPISLLSLRSGDLAVLDKGLGTVVILRDSANPIVQAGRLGEGPGEFGQAAHELFATGDSSFGVVDVAHRRVVEFTVDGEYTRMVPTSFGSGPALGYGARPDGKLFRFDAVLLRSPEGRGQYAPTVQMVGLGDSLGAKEFKTGGDTVGGLYVARPMVAIDPSGAGFVIGSSHDGTLAFMDWQGTSNSVWHAVGRKEEIEDGDKRFLLEQGMRKVTAPNKEEFIDKMLSSVGLGDFYPRFTRLVLSRDEVWINLPTTAAELRAGQSPDFDFDNTGSRNWLVVSRQGKVLRQARLPAGFKLFAVTARGPIGTARDSEGVGSVELLRAEN